jgi:hypothetical protein
VKLTKKELRALRLFRDKPVQATGYVHGKTRHALERKKLLHNEGRGWSLTAAGHTVLAPAADIPNIFNDLFPSRKGT